MQIVLNAGSLEAEREGNVISVFPRRLELPEDVLLPPLY